MLISIYQLKPRFQALLRPQAELLARIGITANQVTIAGMLVSVAIGGVLLHWNERRELFLLLPAWMFLRMALNALDGMLARDFGQKSLLGAYLNELSDVVSDAVLYLPFVAVAPFGWASIGSIIFLSGLSEMAGAMGPMIGADRRYDGPMGKSDRAFVFGALGLWVAVASALPGWVFWLMPAMAGAIAVNVVNRVRGGIQQASMQTLRKESV